MAERYEKGEIIGEGGFGEVYQADKKTKQIVALKRIKKIDQTALNEVETLQKVKGHPNVANIDTYFISEGSLWLVTEFCNGGDLNKYFWEAKPNPSTKYLLMTQMANAVAFLHEKGVAHRDLKPENVLINFDSTQKPTAKLTDFGLAKLQCGNQITGQYMSTCAGTAFFMAPEVQTSESYTVKADIFSMGVIFRAMIFESSVQCGSSGRYLVSCTRTSEGFIVPLGEVLAHNPRLRITVSEQAISNASARQLLDSMLERDVSQRFSASAVVNSLSSLTPDNLKLNVTGNSPQTATDDERGESAGQRLLARLTATVKSTNPSQSKSEAAAHLCAAIASQFSKAELVVMKQEILVLYIFVCRMSTNTEKLKVEKWIRPVLLGIDQLLLGNKLAGSDAALFAVGWLRFMSMFSDKK